MSATHPRARRLAASVLGLTLTLPVTVAFPSADAVETGSLPDGRTAATAAASCWEIAQNTPEAPSGEYWLVTPALGAPEQFYCDQETAGGGWVLVGRGREGWSESRLGSGTPAQVRETVSGIGAFTPRQLSADTVEALNNDGSISGLEDGIRLRRAANSGGTAWQEVRFSLGTPRDTWTWQFDNEQSVASYSFDGVVGSGGTTESFGSNHGSRRVHTQTSSTEGWSYGFGYGYYARGSAAADSHLWASVTGGRYARPFTQVYLRPKLMSADLFTQIPDGGTPSTTEPPVVRSFAERQSWGVSGIGAGPLSKEGSNEVSAFAESGDTVFVGGNFTHVQQSRGGENQQDQSYLAAFDRDSATWRSTFRPTFDNQVKDVVALPGGRIAVGGFFTEVNGEPRDGLVVLDATTGQIDEAFTGRLLNALAGGVPNVRALDVQGGWLYAAGSFTHSTGGGRKTYTKGATRFAIEDGTPSSWNPDLNATVMGMDASDQGDRVYFAGYFTQSRGRSANSAVALRTDSEDIVPWSVKFSMREPDKLYQQTVLEVGDRVWLGGSQHQLMSYRRADLSIASTNISNPGGDFQALATDGSAVYAGCHCFSTSYSGATTYYGLEESPGPSWTSADAIYATGAWDATTGALIPSFNPKLNTGRGAGSWALFVDSTGTLWQGGDHTYSLREGYVRQWSGGFVRHAAGDSKAPSAPMAPAAQSSSDGDRLTWTASTDDRAVTSYEILREDRVIAQSAGTSVTVPAAAPGTRYFVRAVDAAGNRSASTPAFSAPIAEGGATP